jgi:hypothetical protein
VKLLKSRVNYYNKICVNYSESYSGWQIDPFSVAALIIKGCGLGENTVVIEGRLK